MDTKTLALACALSIGLHVGAAFLVDGQDGEGPPPRRLSVTLVRQAKGGATPRTPNVAPTPQTTPTHSLRSPGSTIGSADAEPKAASTELPTPEGTVADAVAQDTFLTSDQLTSAPEPQGDIDLNIPEAKLLTNPGTLVLKLWIDETGVVVRTELERSELPPAYSDAVVRVFGSAVFAPGQVNGQPVNSILRIETRYE